MDDLQFRRTLLAEPNKKDRLIDEAKSTDEAKNRFAQEVNKLEEQINEALNVPVPDDLYNKLILRQTMASHQLKKKKTKVHYAIAASVAAALALSVSYFQFSSAYNDIGDYALAHVYHEADYFTNDMTKRVSLEQLNKKMTSFSGAFSKEIGELMFADYCRFDGMKSLHLVLKGANSPVNIFIVPASDHLAFNEDFADNQLKGHTIKYGQSNIIVVSDNQEPIEKWQNKIANSVSWST